MFHVHLMHLNVMLSLSIEDVVIHDLTYLPYYMILLKCEVHYYVTIKNISPVVFFKSKKFCAFPQSSIKALTPLKLKKCNFKID